MDVRGRDGWDDPEGWRRGLLRHARMDVPGSWLVQLEKLCPGMGATPRGDRRCSLLVGPVVLLLLENIAATMDLLALPTRYRMTQVGWLLLESPMSAAPSSQHVLLASSHGADMRHHALPVR